MNRSSDRTWGRAAMGLVVAVLGAAASVAGAQDAADEPTREQVIEKVREVHRSVREAERVLARSLSAADRPGDAARAAGASIAKLLDEIGGDSRRAAAAMQWLVDNAPE